MGRVIPLRPHASDDWLPRPVPAPTHPQPPARRGSAALNPYAPPLLPSQRAPHPLRVARTGRRRVATAAVLVAVLATAAALVLHAHMSGDSAGGRPDAGHAGVAPSSSGGSALTWTTRQGVAYPLSPTSGPFRHDGSVASGFARDDLGAAIAAAWIVYQASPEPGPAVYRPALAAQVTGPAAPALADTVSAGYAQAAEDSHLSAGAPLGTGTTTFTGYHVTPLQGGGRHVTVYERAPDANGVDQVFTLDVDLTWAGGDWKVIAPSSGDWSSAFAELPAAPPGVTAFTPPSPSPVGQP